MPARPPGVTRRTALHTGVLGLGGLGLADLLRARSAKASPTAAGKSVILLWLDGGPSQLETWDPKPDAPAEYRGPFGVCQSPVAGTIVSSLMPETAKRAGKVALVRSLHHDTGDHFAAAHWMTTGRFGATTANQGQKSPSIGSVVARVKGANAPGLPPYVGLPAAETVYLFPGYMGASYLGAAYNPFDVDRVKRYQPVTTVTKVRSPAWLTGLGAGPAAKSGPPPDWSGRAGLLRGLDDARRAIDATGAMDTLDTFQQQAADLVLGGAARNAFDIDREDPKTAERYGPAAWGQYTMMARRLVEAGVAFVTVDMPYWDDHSGIEKGHGTKVPVVDRAVGALLDDLSDRGLLDRVMVIVMGEFGRTPRINTGQPGIPVPGRDHWGNAISLMMAGGGIPGGVVVGKTSGKAEHPVDRPVSPADILATVYHHLGIDPTKTFKDHSGRPVPLVDTGRPITELV